MEIAGFVLGLVSHYQARFRLSWSSFFGASGGTLAVFIGLLNEGGVAA